MKIPMMGRRGPSAYLRREELATLVRENLKRADLLGGMSKNYCVGLVDVANSTVNTARIPSSKMGEYYGIFLNAMTTIVEEFGAKVIKNIGDSLLYYFPRTDYASDRDSFLDVLECSLAMVDSHDTLNCIMTERSLPRTDYRISADYGIVTKSPTRGGEDLFGPTVNLCTKINGAAPPNGFVIGGDLFQLVKALRCYTFGVLGSYGLGLKFSYPVYTVQRRAPNISLQ